jgi:RNA polymerase sigma factor (sigma-70 family)
MASIRECELVTEAQQGSEAAYASLIQETAPALLRYLATIMHDSMRAEDVAQETFVRAFRSLATLREPERFRPWLWRIARCAAIDALRRARSLDAGAPEIVLREDLDVMFSSEPTTEYWMRYQALLDQVKEAVSDLPDGVEQLLRMRYCDGHAYQAIAEQTGLTLVQIKARLARARAKLRGMLRGAARDWKHIRDAMSS